MNVPLYASKGEERHINITSKIVNKTKMSKTTNDSATSIIQPQCKFFVVRKKRLCRMTVRPGRQYCGEHEPQHLAENLETDKRIPCPNDPKHTCYASKLEKHLAKCNARQTEDPPYIIRNLNAPEEENPCPRVLLKDVLTDTLTQVIEKVTLLYERHVRDTISTWHPPPSHHEAVEGDIEQCDRADSSRRHLRQASRLMQLAEEEALVRDDTCYVELGAGKGMLSYYMGLAWCNNKSSVMCVDRASLRHKRDNLLRGATAGRVRADLRHLALDRTPLVTAAEAVVGIAKHLCGVATDYALRCVSADEVLKKTRGVLVATCCHHRCERGAYVGTRKLEELGITAEELNIMYGIVSWATCGDGRSREQRLAHNNSKHEDMEEGDKHTNDREGNNEQQINADEILLNARRNNHEHSTQENQRTIAKNVENNTNAVEDGLSTVENEIKKRKVEASTTETTTQSDMVQTETVTESNITETAQKVIKESIEDETNTSQDLAKERVKPSYPLPINIREEVGRRAKALIDYGRVLYLRDRGFQARLCYYVPTVESLENVCIVAKKLET